MGHWAITWQHYNKSVLGQQLLKKYFKKKKKKKKKQI